MARTLVNISELSHSMPIEKVKVLSYTEELEKINKIDDPREEILLRFKAFLNLYKEDSDLMTFIIINTGNTDTLILKKANNAYITEHNLKYIQIIENLCKRCIDETKDSSVLTSRALCEGILGISEGILLGWYLADKSDNQDTSR